MEMGSLLPSQPLKASCMGPSINNVTPKLAIFDHPLPHVTRSVKILIDLNKRKMQ